MKCEKCDHVVYSHNHAASSLCATHTREALQAIYDRRSGDRCVLKLPEKGATEQDMTCAYCQAPIGTTNRYVRDSGETYHSECYAGEGR